MEKRFKDGTTLMFIYIHDSFADWAEGQLLVNTEILLKVDETSNWEIRLR